MDDTGSIVVVSILLWRDCKYAFVPSSEPPSTIMISKFGCV
jgi:hypothetical protein